MLKILKIVSSELFNPYSLLYMTSFGLAVSTDWANLIKATIVLILLVFSGIVIYKRRKNAK